MKLPVPQAMKVDWYLPPCSEIVAATDRLPSYKLGRCRTTRAVLQTLSTRSGHVNVFIDYILTAP